jgi:hypothetical protein
VLTLDEEVEHVHVTRLDGVGADAEQPVADDRGGRAPAHLSPGAAHAGDDLIAGGLRRDRHVREVIATPT